MYWKPDLDVVSSSTAMKGLLIDMWYIFHFRENCFESVSNFSFFAEPTTTPVEHVQVSTPVVEPKSETPISDSPVSEVVTEENNPDAEPQTESEPEAETSDEGEFPN